MMEEKWVVVEPGVILSELNIFLAKHGLQFGPETSTANRCCMGGMLGNNSCGLHSIIYGSAQNGNGSTLKFPLSNLNSTAVFQIHATDIKTGCRRILDTVLHIQVNCCLADISEYIKIPPPANGLVAYYPFNGNALDESQNGNNGTIYGASLTKDKSGKLNSAFSFDGNDYISVNNKSSINFDTSDFSISMWIYPKVIKNMYISGKDNYNGSQPSPYGSGYYFQYSVAKSQDIRFATRSIDTYCWSQEKSRIKAIYQWET